MLAGLRPHREHQVVICWDRTELIEFFGIIPTFYEDAQSHAVELSRDGLRLEFTLFDAVGAVYISVFRDGVTDPIIDIVRERCTHAFITEFPSCAFES